MNKLTATFFLHKIPTPIGDVAPGELPKQFKFTSRVIPNSLEIDGKKFSIRVNDNYKDENLAQLGLINYEGIAIETISEIEDQHQAVIDFMDKLETICDNLAFKMQVCIYIAELKVQKINDDNIEEGEGILYAFPNGYQPEKSIRALFVSQIGEVHPNLEHVIFDLDKQTAAALKWYHKALLTQFEIDKFIYFFIVCEILWNQSKTKVKQSYKNSCGHEILNCPICNESTERVVNGASIKSFLEEDCNVTKDIAKQIWNYRQILHGSNDAFKSNNNLSALVVELQAAITNRLKIILSIPEHSAPIINKDVPMIAQMGLTTIV